jgi:hypothetical protein
MRRKPTQRLAAQGDLASPYSIIAVGEPVVKPKESLAPGTDVKWGNARLILNHDRLHQSYQNRRRYYFEDWSPEEQRKRQASCIVIHEAVPVR